jgi:phospholipid/cholesterol/gamma-HCH transport system permease protein
VSKTGSKMLPGFTNFLQTQFASAGSQAGFIAAFFRHTFRRGFEWNEFFNQCYLVGNKSLGLIGITGFILGFVMTLQSEPTMRDFGAESFVPSMVAISIIREIGPVIIALICAGKVASGMGAELASMKVSEQIDAMEVSGANPMQYLVVTRMLACILMVPLLTLIGDALAIFGGFAASNINNNMSFTLYFAKAFAPLEFTDLIPAVIKTVFFGFAIGFAGCYKGFTANNGTESVGVAANSAVVMASLWVIVLDAVAVQITSLIAYN